MTLIDPQTYEGVEKKVQKVVYQGRELAAKTYLAVNLAGHDVDQTTAARAELNTSRQARLSKLKKMVPALQGQSYQNTIRRFNCAQNHAGII